MIKRILYVDKENKEFMRTFATTTVINANPNQNVVVDFYEEYLQPFLVVEENLDNNAEDVYSHNQR